MNILVKREELWQSFLSLGSFEKSTEYYAALLEIASAKGKQIISPIYNEICADGKSLYFIVKAAVG